MNMLGEPCFFANSGSWCTGMKSRDAIAPATITVAVTGISRGVTSSPTLMSRQSRVVVRDLQSHGGHPVSFYVRGAEARQLRRRRTERQLVVLGPQEVTEQGIGGVDADSPVHLLGGRRDTRARLGRPEFRDGGLPARRPVLTEEPGGLPHGPADRLDVDERVGHPLLHGLEAADRPAELLAFGGVGGGHAQRTLRHAELDRAQPDKRAGIQRLDDLGAVAGKPVVAGNGCAVEEYVGVRLAVGRHGGSNLDPVGVRVDAGRRRRRRRRAVAGHDASCGRSEPQVPTPWLRRGASRRRRGVRWSRAWSGRSVPARSVPR